MENNYQNPPAPPSNIPEPVQAQYAKAKPAGKPKSSASKTLLAILGLLIFFGIGMTGVLISQKQFVAEPTPVAPNVPVSQPEAAIEKSSCTLTFTVQEKTEPAECGYSPCELDADCSDDLVCITADDGDNYCAVSDYEAACADDPTVTNCCEEPTEETTYACGEKGCTDNFDCDAGYICVSADDGNNYCGEPDYKAACADDPSETSCCTAPSSTPTPTLTITPTAGQPDLPEELPQSGPEDWLRYLQAGLATLGAGALLLLLL